MLTQRAQYIDIVLAIVTLGYHHGQSLRWVGGWPGDGLLAVDCAEQLVKWFADHQVTGPLRAVEAEREQEAEDERQTARAARGLSPTLQSALRNVRQPADGADEGARRRDPGDQYLKRFEQ